MPTPYLLIEGLTKSVGHRMLFADVNLAINEGDKIGLIAKNGAGKSTMLRILATGHDYDSGTITPRNDLRIGYLDQDSTFTPGLTVIEACLEKAPVPADEVLADNGYSYTQRLIQLLTQLGIADTGALVDTQSGGQLKRMALACVLIAEPELLLLDEPTNHLDIKAIEWLEGYLRRSRATMLMVTHDRYFLDRVCNKIIEIDRESVYSYDGNYAYFQRRRAERIEALAAEQTRLKNTLRREQEWMSRQPQARASKAKYRIDQYYDLKQRASVNLTERQVNLNVQQSKAYIGNKIFEAKDICKAFGDKKILDHFTYTFARGEKVGLIGANGVGKSTFVKMLQGIVAQDSGDWNVGQTVRFGYYSQEGIEFKPGQRVIDAVQDYTEEIEVAPGQTLSPMQFLQHFLFSVPDQQKYIETLSGGERRRLHLATVLMRNPNFLILDEPTNDLDIVTLGILEDYVANFRGCVLVISHDRYFLDNIVDHIFVMEGDGKVTDFPGNYSDYRQYLDERQRQQRKEEKSAPAASPSRPRPQRKAKLSYKEQRELEAIEAELAALEQEKGALEAAFNSTEPSNDIATKAARYQEVKDKIDDLELRWLELNEKIE